MTAVEEPVDRFFGDRRVRVALLSAMVGELAQHPLLDLEPVSAGVTQSDQVGDQVRQRRLSLDPRASSSPGAMTGKEWS